MVSAILYRPIYILETNLRKKKDFFLKRSSKSHILAVETICDPFLFCFEYYKHEELAKGFNEKVLNEEIERNIK